MVIAAKKPKNKASKDAVFSLKKVEATARPVIDNIQYGNAILKYLDRGLTSFGYNTSACSLNDGMLCHNTK